MWVIVVNPIAFRRGLGGKFPSENSQTREHQKAASHCPRLCHIRALCHPDTPLGSEDTVEGLRPDASCSDINYLECEGTVAGLL